MNSTLIATALGMPEDSSDRDILDRIENMMRDAGETDIASLSDRELLERNLHENVTVDALGADITLYVPIKSGTEEITSIRLRRPTFKHLRTFDEKRGGDLSKLGEMACELSGKTMAQLDKLDGADSQLLVTVLVFLRRPPRRTGAKS